MESSSHISVLFCIFSGFFFIFQGIMSSSDLVQLLLGTLVPEIALVLKFTILSMFFVGILFLGAALYQARTYDKFYFVGLLVLFFLGLGLIISELYIWFFVTIT